MLENSIKIHNIYKVDIVENASKMDFLNHYPLRVLDMYHEKRNSFLTESMIKMDEYINLQPSRSSPMDRREQHIYSLKNAPKRDFS